MHKRTETTVIDVQGNKEMVTKGAPQVITAMAKLDAATETEDQQAVNAMAAKGYRALGVAQSK